MPKSHTDRDKSSVWRYMKVTCFISIPISFFHYSTQSFFCSFPSSHSPKIGLFEICTRKAIRNHNPAFLLFIRFPVITTIAELDERFRRNFVSHLNNNFYTNCYFILEPQKQTLIDTLANVHNICPSSACSPGDCVCFCLHVHKFGDFILILNCSV